MMSWWESWSIYLNPIHKNDRREQVAKRDIVETLLKWGADPNSTVDYSVWN